MSEAIAFPAAEHFARLPKTTSSWFDECRMESEEWLIERLIPRRSYTGIFGRRGAAKTFLAIEIACCGALGQPFLGEEVECFGSLYCVGEKKSRFGKRVEAWRISRGVTRIPVLFRWGVPNLLDEGEVDDFIAELEQCKPDFLARGAPLRAVFLDTLSRSLKGANVSDADATGRALNAIQRIIDETGVTVLPLAHVAKADGANSQKGAGEWEDAADALIRIDREGDSKLRTVTLTKQSDEADGLAYGFELEVVDVGTTPAGKRVTSCVIRQVDAPQRDKGLVPRLNAAAEMTLAALRDLDAEGQAELLPLSLARKAGARGVRIDVLRERTFRAGLRKAEEPPADASKVERNRWLNTRRTAFRRAVDDLVKSRQAAQAGDFVCLP